MESSAWPSAGCLSTSVAASVITAPGLFSTMILQSSPSERALATTRARMSGGVPADPGTTTRMILDGYDCANAGFETATPRPAAAVPVKNARLFMGSSLSVSCNSVATSEQWLTG